jgi:predicted kinase
MISYDRIVNSFTVVLANGLSATGKTTIGKQVANALSIPYFAKDAVKERLFDALGYSDREWAHKLSGATHAVLNYVLEEELGAGRGFVIEANFNPEYDVEKYSRWRAKYGFALVQLLCYADGEVVFERFKRRVESGERHPGHVDHLNVEAFRGYLMQGKCQPLDVGGTLIEVDTTDFSRVDIDAIVSRIRGIER